jgi:hypothetical protein
MMKKIYDQANNVIIWLGQSSALIEEGMPEMPHLTEKLNGFDGQLGFEPEALAAHQLPALGSGIWLGLYDLLSRQWFIRV